jgi:NAD(P)-dependent dehydrogenase (short-subunit alcohol dehydrogenase family)
MIARGYLEVGAKVYISSRKKAVCDEVARQLSEVGPCISIPADLSTLEGCKHLAAELAKQEEKLHILVNNAGAAWGAPIEEYPEAGWDKVMDTNVKGIFFLTQACLPLLEKAAAPDDPARVINIGSIDGLAVSDLENFAYGPSKAAVHHLTRNLAVHVGRRNITFNAVAPGPFESMMTKGVMEHFKEGLERTCPLKRIGYPSDMAGVAIFLASRAAAYINGVTIPVDGGISIS